MLILLPLDSRDSEEAQLTNLSKVTTWGLVDLQEGKVQKIDFYDDWEAIDDYFECVVVVSAQDDIEAFKEQSIPVLEAQMQRSIDDVMEAFLFRELYEIEQ